MATNANESITTTVTGSELGGLSGLTPSMQPLLTTSSVLDVAELKTKKFGGNQTPTI
jgi:hypothetical protein